MQLWVGQVLGLAVLITISICAQAAHVRVTCRGIDEFAMSDWRVTCSDSNLLFLGRPRGWSGTPL